MRLTCLAAALPLAALSPTAPAADAPPAADYAPLALEAGDWDVAVTFFDAVTGAKNGTATGREHNALLKNGHWITNELEIFAADGKTVDFAGRGTWGWDPVAHEYAGSWADTNDGALRIDHGFWVAAQKTMYWTSLQPDGEGHTVGYRMTETFGEAARTLTFFQTALQSGRQIKLAEMTFTRKR